MKNTKKPKILFYDIETTPLAAWVWRLGKQVVRHTQLLTGYEHYNIITLCYAWNDNKAPQALVWDKASKHPSKNLIKQFDALVSQADVVIGKNSNRFDNKHVNTVRMLSGMQGNPTWTKYTDDLEKQLRRHFALPTTALDYVSKYLGLSGKNKMEMQDWVDIVLRTADDHVYKTKINKMVKYCKKDVDDTRKIWYYCESHFTPTINMARYLDVQRGCTQCGSTRIKKNGTRVSGSVKYQTYLCNDCGRYAGNAVISEVTNKEGKIR